MWLVQSAAVSLLVFFLHLAVAATTYVASSRYCLSVQLDLILQIGFTRRGKKRRIIEGEKVKPTRLQKLP